MVLLHYKKDDEDEYLDYTEARRKASNDIYNRLRGK
jgi:hypothetical protein